MCPEARPRGFTLIEVLLALTLGASVVLLAHRVFTGVADGAARLSEARVALDREANARRWLTAAFASADPANGGGFTGHPDEVVFGTWLLTSGGSYAFSIVSVVRQDARLMAMSSSGESIVLADSVADLQFDYLLDAGGAGTPGDSMPGAPGEGARFVREWISPVSAPMAARMRIAKRDRGQASGVRVDTLLMIIGPRG